MQLKFRILCCRHSWENWTWAARKRASTFSPRTLLGKIEHGLPISGTPLCKHALTCLNCFDKSERQPHLPTQDRFRIAQPKPRRKQLQPISVYNLHFQTTAHHCTCFKMNMVKQLMLQNLAPMPGLWHAASLLRCNLCASQVIAPKDCYGILEE